MSKEKQIEIKCENCLYYRGCLRNSEYVPSPCDVYEDKAGYRKQEWVSVDERLPEPNAHVLIYVFFHNQWQIVKGWLSFCDKKFYIANSDYPSLTDVPVTHWMPLPEAPKMKGGAE